jgi:hypothetical protein
MRRRRPDDERQEPAHEPQEGDVLPEDHLDPFWALADVRWPWALSPADRLAWARQHAPKYVETDEQARANRDRRLAASRSRA